VHYPKELNSASERQLRRIVPPVPVRKEFFMAFGDPVLSPAELLGNFYDLLGKVVLIPIPLGQKRPQLPSWQNLTFSSTQAADYQLSLRDAIKAGGNLGVLLGPASDGLVAIDIDSDQKVEAFLELNPSLANTLRTRGARGCQFWTRLTPGSQYPNTKAVYFLKDPSGAKYGEWRCGGGNKGAQSIIWGRHPEGMRYSMVVDQAPLITDFAYIRWIGERGPHQDQDQDDSPPETQAQPPTSEQPGTREQLSAELASRITKYVKGCPAAKTGQHGHNLTFAIACTLINEYALLPEQALPFFRIYNRRCQPPWSESELTHKLAGAQKAKHKRPRGCLRDQQPNIDLSLDDELGCNPTVYEELRRDFEQQSEAQQYQLRGGSPLDYLNRGVHEEDILVGNGWLERGSAFFLVAQSGIGKSHIVTQICICWACGKGGPHAFFLDPFNGRPLRIVVVQNEDSQNDLYRQSLVLNGLELSYEQTDLVHSNLWVETLRGKLGNDAIQLVRRILDLRNGCDLVVLNPLSAYVKGDLTRTEDAVDFLYGQFSPLLDEYQCGGAAAHHTPKSTGASQKNKVNWTSYDFMYSGAGAATLTNFARAYITIDPKGSSQVFDVRMAKRFAESCWPTSQQLFKWADRKDCRLWVPASAAEADQAQAKTQKTIQDLRKFVPATGVPIPVTTLEQEACKKGGFTQRAFRAVLDEARSETTPDNLRLYYWRIYNPEGGMFAAYARYPQPEDQKPDAVKARIKDQKRSGCTQPTQQFLTTTEL
jgi:hypothetical protein